MTPITLGCMAAQSCLQPCILTYLTQISSAFTLTSKHGDTVVGMSMIDDCKPRPFLNRDMGTDLRTVVEYSAGPSRPGVNQAARTLQGQQETSFSDVDYEGYEVDEDDIADENQGMIQAVRQTTAAW